MELNFCILSQFSYAPVATCVLLQFELVPLHPHMINIFWNVRTSSITSAISGVGVLFLSRWTIFHRERETAFREVYPENVNTFPHIVRSLLIRNTKKKPYPISNKTFQIAHALQCRQTMFCRNKLFLKCRHFFCALPYKKWQIKVCASSSRSFLYSLEYFLFS